MAVVTSNAFMPAVQLKFGFLVVIEVPNFPITRIVASFTLRPKAKFMDVFFFMATYTFDFRILKCGRQMALFTLHLVMPASQRKLGFIVIKFRLRPGFFNVAILTLITQLTLVLVILLMAGNTGAFQLIAI